MFLTLSHLEKGAQQTQQVMLKAEPQQLLVASVTSERVGYLPGSREARAELVSSGDRPTPKHRAHSRHLGILVNWINECHLRLSEKSANKK